jgi:putative inorganic carbon (HCO3(-)) transporter
VHTDRPYSKKIFWLETAVFILITPFLLFPDVSIMGTFFSLILLAGLWFLPVLIDGWPPLPKTPLNNAILLFSLMLIVSILVTADVALTLPKATGLLLGLSVWRYLSIFGTDRRLLAWFVVGFVVAGLGFTMIGILNANWLSKIPLLDNIARQLPGMTFLIPGDTTTGVHTNQIASTILIWLLLIISLALGNLILRKAFVHWALVALPLILGSGLLLLTQSRSGYIGMAGSLLLLFFVWQQQLPKQSHQRKWVTAVILIMVVSGIAGLAWLGPDRLVEIWQDPNQESVVGNLNTIGFRQEVWRWGVAATADFPFTGTGLGTFRQVVRRLYPLNITPSYDIAHAHNIFLQTALDMGIPGLIAYIAILLSVAWMAWEVGKKDEGLRPFSLGILSGIVALHLFGMTDALALGAKPGLLFWMAIGLITAMHQIVVHKVAET